jgi:hypothetical protein
MLDQLLQSLGTDGAPNPGQNNQLADILNQLSPEQRTQLQGHVGDGQGGFDLGKIMQLFQSGQLQQLLGNIDLGQLQGLLGNLDLGNLQNLLGGLTDGTPTPPQPNQPTENTADGGGLTDLLNKVL